MLYQLCWIYAQVASAKAAAKTHAEELSAARAEAASSKAEARGLIDKVSQLEKRAKVLLTFKFLLIVADYISGLSARLSLHSHCSVKQGICWRRVHFGADMADRGCKGACCAPLHWTSFKHQGPKVVCKSAGGLCSAHQSAPGRTGQGCACRGDAQGGSAGLQDC